MSKHGVPGSFFNVGVADNSPAPHISEVEKQIRTSIGMRERDQHDAMIDFGDKKITAEQLKALSDESRELFVEDLLRIADHHTQAVLDLLTSKLPPTPRKPFLEGSYTEGRRDALWEVREAIQAVKGKK